MSTNRSVDTTGHSITSSPPVCKDGQNATLTLGRSSAGSVTRTGFEHMVAEVCLRNFLHGWNFGGAHLLFQFTQPVQGQTATGTGLLRSLCPLAEICDAWSWTTL